MSTVGETMLRAPLTPEVKARMVDGFAGSLRSAGLVHREPPNALGIDPGLKGGLALLATDPYARGVRVHPMPTTKTKAGRDAYDVPGLIRLLQSMIGDGPLRQHVVAFVERLGPMPPMIARAGGFMAGAGGGQANYQRGRASMLFEALLPALGIEYHLVGPKQWQDEMLPLRGGDTGQRSILMARKLFPDVSLYATARSRKPSDGLSDALLLAEFGRRRLANAETAPGLFKNYSEVTR